MLPIMIAYNDSPLFRLRTPWNPHAIKSLGRQERDAFP
jgi:hypothetical protein